MNNNVDHAELMKFSELAAKWWDREGPMRPLHDINPARLEWIDRLASLAGKRIVDVGCGGGVLTEAMAQKGAFVLGIDLADKPLKVAQLHALDLKARVEYRECAAEKLAAAEPESFDVVTCMEMLEHVPEPAQTVLACAALAKPGGSVFFSTINRNVKAFALAIVGAEYVLNLLPRGTHEYAKFLKPSELARYARAAGLEVREVIGMRYNPLTKSAALSSDTDVNYLMACSKLG
ncbi:MAG TPA: bifunctional 2-polyprenyl-6-hydroxyphenol methylase/3-demethylubiquinol 3-O-methyltransferase UbiG [Burkholderiaceae bacterium]|nr:bifunctional 2-polyprenyl-6-hydroxyphenol methylase/3-demethylubiquinol 3-O-methyltransferase UbiG [Burkholderiaceae bacterium]